VPNSNNDSLPSFVKGEAVSAAKLNRIVDAIARRMVGGRDIRVTAHGNQIIIGGGPRFQEFQIVGIQMRVKSVQGDYLTCRALDAQGVEDTGDVLVLKPWTLRRTPFEGKTVAGVAYTYNSNIERIANPATDNITYQVTPDYWTNSVILVEYQNVTEEVTAGEFTRLVDKNVDGRTWAQV
jgi:hypothetical protein